MGSICVLKMMKNRLLFIVLFCSLLSYAQQRIDVSLNWKDNVKSLVGSVPVTVPVFQEDNMSYDGTLNKLYFVKVQPVTSAINKNSLQVSDIVYESVTRQQLGSLSLTAIPSSINASLETMHARSEYFAFLKLSPIIKDGNNFKRIKSFSYSFSPGTNPKNAATANVISSSVLSSGEWHRFYVEKSGVYKITRSFLQQMGVDVNVDPRNLKIYGNGGRMLPLLNSTSYPLDLAENAVTFIGEQDGSFDNNDYILFYAEGVDNWSVENGTHNNLYSNRSYYYVSSRGGAGKRINTMVQPSGTPNITTGIFDEYQFYEKDLISIARVGRKWHGEQFNVDNEQSFEFTIPDIDLSIPNSISITASAAASAVNATSMAVTANGTPLGTLNFGALTSPQQVLATEDTKTFPYSPSGEAISIGLNYSNNGVPGSNSWLDYIIVKAKRRLRGNGRQFRFQLNDAANNTGVIEYQLSNASGISEVWDITNIYDAFKAVNTGGQGNFSFKAALGEVRKYIAVTPSDYYTPLKEANARVANQNIKGTIFNNSQGQFQDIDYLIIAPEFLTGSAERLANMHRIQSGLRVKVVRLENIYQEFSSGKQDIGAIRNFVKYVYNNATSDDKRVKYLNLFGDASFDFKDRIPNNTNIVPILHGYTPGGTDNYSNVTTFVSDDFFGLMDPDEGPMTGTSDGIDIATGRMLVTTKENADAMVNKVLEYRGPESYGRWRNEYLVITDDLDNNGEGFVPQMEQLTNDLTEDKPFINVRKIHTDAYLQQASAGGQRYPEAKQQIINSINFGTLVVNYLGHGGEEGIASEQIFVRSDAQALTNRYKYPLFITATCELTKFDNPYRPTAGEDLYLNPSGGAIAMITTTRSIFINVAFTFGARISRELFAIDNGTNYPTMAEALRRAKVATMSNARIVSFVGDPALFLAIPRPRVELTKINNVPLAESTDVLQALGYVELGGRVTDEAGNNYSNYNGELAVTVFDKPVERLTLGNDNVQRNVGTIQNPIMETIYTPFSTLGETLFRGNATITNGQFNFGFVVPRDIRIPVGQGRVSFYAKRNNILENQTGFDSVIKVGGVNENAVADTTPPAVKLFMNEETFISGGITNSEPIFLAFLEDQHGMNTSSGIGHDMLAILDGDETNPYILNDYYETELDNYKKGKLRFPFAKLEKGLHTLVFKAWDVYNNLITSEIQFVVIGDDEMHIEKVLNYPNPFVSYTEFWFTHNRPFEPLDVQVQIFTVTGKVVKTINQQVITDGFLSRDIKWDGKDDFGDRIGKGVYVYKLTVRSPSSNKSAEKYEKLVLL